MILDFTAKKIADTIDSFNNPNKALFIYGHTGKGKTYSALKYCAENKNCLYFSFRNLDSEFALRVFQILILKFSHRLLTGAVSLSRLLVTQGKIALQSFLTILAIEMTRMNFSLLFPLSWKQTTTLKSS